ncbi:MAG: hypothetical protein ACJ746_22595 [Bryobacteraceae bacterium]
MNKLPEATNQQHRDKREARLLEDGRLCLQLGYFQGALNASSQIRQNSDWADSADLIKWIARIYLGERHWAEASQMTQTMAMLKQLRGGVGFAECACLSTRMFETHVVARHLQEVLQLIDDQHGVLVTWHPSAVLCLAEYARQSKDLKSAISLTNIALGFRSVFVSLADVRRLASLLICLRAPAALWADWCSICIQHLRFAGHRPAIFRSKLATSKDAESWALSEARNSEQILRAVLAQAPREAWTLLQKVAPQLYEAGSHLAHDVRSRFAPSEVAGPAVADHLWSEERSLRYRYFWYDMISGDEQNLVRNGDWAMFGLPTEDYSMGLAQWWRILESVLKRSIIKPLVSKFAECPELASLDRNNLTLSRQKEEAVFLDKLAFPDRASKMTLGDILLVLKKCESTNDRGIVGSRMRIEAAKFLKSYSTQIGPLTKGTPFSPSHLNEQNITWFRNRSSHDGSMSLVDASIGCLLSKRILNGFYAPVITSWGFEAQLL